ncbi:MAG: D-glycero-alpha-D-manno-heptose-1,7-bisphosphate 7-phosphatase [Bryobacteraceae bacterium]
MPDECLTPAGFLDAEGLWRLACGDLSWARGRPALFLDRDGVVVEEVDYLHRAEDVALIAGAAELIAEANRRGIPVVIASNQAGIARGYFGWPEFQQVQAELNRRLGRAGARVDLTLACPHYPEHPDRKPRPGMFRKAAEMAALDLGRSWVIGDKTSDLEAARAAGLSGGVLVLTGHGAHHQAGALGLETPAFRVTIGNSIAGTLWLLDELAAGRQW